VALDWAGELAELSKKRKSDAAFGTPYGGAYWFFTSDSQCHCLEPRMSKRKPATASKRSPTKHKPATASNRSPRPKVNARAQQNKQAVVRSAKERRMSSVAEASTEPRVEIRADATQEIRNVESPAAAFHSILRAGFSPKTREGVPVKGFDFLSLTANMQAYQAKFLEVAQANMQFSLHLTQRLAAIRSPFEFGAVVAEFTGRRILMIGKHSKELAAALTRE
jgi:hypothetical protein